LFTDQMSNFADLNWPNGCVEGATIALAQLQASLDHPGTIITVGPKYQLPYAGDGLHLRAPSEEHWGEKYAEVYKTVVIEGGTWEPLYPASVASWPSDPSGRTLQVTMHVPFAPLVFDTTLVTDPGYAVPSCAAPNGACRGFGYTEPSVNSPVIDQTPTILGNSVLIHLSAPPTPGVTHAVYYGFYPYQAANSGPTTGPRGNLRDSDLLVSRYDGTPIYNWLVHFKQSF